MMKLLCCPPARGVNKYDNFLSKGYAQTAISTKVPPSWLYCGPLLYDTTV